MRRHDFVHLHRDAAFSTHCAATGDADWQAARAWIAAGRPLVAARQLAGGERLRLGLCLPLARQRKKLAIDVAPEALASVAGPVPVASCVARLPAAHAEILRRLAAAAAACGAGLGVYGSLAWEAVSGESYRHAESDIDLICDVATMAQFATLLAALRQAADALPCRLDGEMRFPGGDAVAWPELAAQRHQPAGLVLVKGEREVGLRPMQALLATLAEEPCHA